MPDYVNFVELWLIICCLIILCQAKTYIIGQDCDTASVDVTENDEIYVSYDGEDTVIKDSKCSYITFYPKGADSDYSYKICVSPEYFEDPDCKIELTYKKVAPYADPFQTFSCSNQPTVQYCGDSDERFIIKMKRKRKDNSKFKLKVIAVKTHHHPSDKDELSTPVKCILGILAVKLVIFIIWICYKCIQWRRKRHAGAV